jgi:hypothetical protein
VRLAALLLFVAACGGKVESTPVTTERDQRAGFVLCGDRACDVGSGNQCYSCNSGVDWQCHTLDLPTRCEESTIVRRDCDGQEDCKSGTTCVIDAYLSTLCR